MSDLIARAEEFARLVHGGKNISHQKDMVLTLKELNITQNKEILASAWLINTLKDTQITYSTLKLQFGKEVADIVYSVTHSRDDNFGGEEKARLLKLLDRVVATEYSIDINSDLYSTYKKQFPLFKKHLYDEKSITYPIIYLWYYLENLYRDEEERLSIEELEDIAKDIYSTNLDEKEDEYYDNCYQIVEELMYDQ